LHCEKTLHAYRIPDAGQQANQYFYNCHLYGRSKLGENFLVNLALFSGETINFSATIRSKDKAVRDIIHRQLQAQNLQELA
jgi:hypothetical protein